MAEENGNGIVSMKFEKEELEELDHRYVEAEDSEYSSRSEAIRAALDKMLRKSRDPFEYMEVEPMEDGNGYTARGRYTTVEDRPVTVYGYGHGFREAVDDLWEVRLDRERE